MTSSAKRAASSRSDPLRRAIGPSGSQTRLMWRRPRRTPLRRLPGRTGRHPLLRRRSSHPARRRLRSRRRSTACGGDRPRPKAASTSPPPSPPRRCDSACGPPANPRSPLWRRTGDFHGREQAAPLSATTQTVEPLHARRRRQRLAARQARTLMTRSAAQMMRERRHRMGRWPRGAGGCRGDWRRPEATRGSRRRVRGKAAQPQRTGP